MMQKIKRKTSRWLLGYLCLLGGLFATCHNSNDYEIYATLYGTVIDNTNGKALENAIITISPLNYSQKTDTTGSFRFEKLDAQQYTIIVQKTGYQPNRKNVTAISGEETECNISLFKIDNN